MKTKIRILSLGLILLSAQAMAQTSNKATEGSGSGNGSENRDLVNYQSQLKESSSSIQSLEEAFNQLKKSILDLSTAEIPTYETVGASFWDKLQPGEMELVKSFDEPLLKAVQNSIEDIGKAQSALVNELATLNATAQSESHFSERGYEKKFRERLETDKNLAFEHIEDALKLSINDLLDAYQEIIEYSPPANLLVLTPYAEKCKSATCVDLIGKRANQYLSFVEKSLKMKILLLGKTYTLFELGEYTHAYHLKTYDIYQMTIPCESKKKLKSFSEQTKNYLFAALYTKNQQAIQNQKGDSQ